MSGFNFDSPEFQSKVKSMIPSIIEDMSSNIKDNNYYKILKGNMMQSFWEQRTNKKTLFSITIREDEITNLQMKCIRDNFTSQIIPLIGLNNIIEVNREFNVISSERKMLGSSTEMKQYLKKLSREGYCVFFFGSDGIDSFVRGDNEEELNKFYTSDDLKRYSEKKDISQLKEVFKEYQDSFLNKQIHYSCFFAEKATVKIRGLDKATKNILKNKPEKFMRDHLLEYLNRHMRHSFLIENELSSTKRRLDIHTEVDGEFYFFEVKWLGVSISDCGTKLTTPYKFARAKEGVIQTLEYIDELINVMKHNVRAGYLVIFDAREDKELVLYENFDFVDDNLKKYLDIFEALDVLKIDNKHPA